ncbi:MAG: hypothetical protein V7719_06395 [Psychroserpens sp.]|uniref:hypothetical protein n=1 Tax=Psychroserpens sp. TaxID=2020870 RepID=UPI003002DA17
MNEAQNNAEKRKSIPLTNGEFLTFFFFPFNRKDGSFNSRELNKIEDERFIHHGFDKKLEQARTARIYGRIFYFGTAVIIGVIIRS